MNPFYTLTIVAAIFISSLSLFALLQTVRTLYSSKEEQFKMQLIWSVSGLGISTVTIMSVVFILPEFSDAGWVSPMLGTICGILIPGTMAHAIDRYGLVPSQSEEAYRLTYDEAVEQACQLALLDRINTVLNKETELEPMIRLFVEAIVETSGYTMVGLYLINGNVLEVQHCHGYEKEASLGHISIDTGVNGRVVRTEQGVRLEDVHADPDFISGLDVASYPKYVFP